MLFSFFFFGMVSSSDSMVLTSWVATSKSKVLVRLLLPPKQALLCFCGYCAELFSVYSLRNLHSSEECSGTNNMHVFFTPFGTSLRWHASFFLRFPAQPLSGLDGEEDTPPSFFPTKTGTVRFCPLSILGRCSSFVD